MNRVRWWLFSWVFSCTAFAADITLVGSLEQALPQSSLQQKSGVFSASSEANFVRLPKVELSDRAWHVVSERVQRALDEDNDSLPVWGATSASKYHQLGMNDVPVLDQGQHGSCVTFAVTEAIDALLYKKDYVSQLCLLQLGTYLEEQQQGMSGWDGSWRGLVLDRIDQFGIMSVSDQMQYGCGGAKQYPKTTQPKKSMSSDTYQQYSQSVAQKIIWEPVVETTNLVATAKDSDASIDAVKAALDAGHRVSFAVLLPRTDKGVVGAVGWHHYFSDTWVITSEIAAEMKRTRTLPSHELLITGYDDTAVAMDITGHRHHGLLTLRNSWGVFAGDWGTFYMSYDYFNALVISASQVRKV
jgi:hypothetical protein